MNRYYGVILLPLEPCYYHTSCLFSKSIAATLTAVDGVTASANGWDTRTSGFGCAPSGCVASNAVDGSLDPASRWSCNSVVSNVNACELTLELDAPQDIEAINIALWKGNERTRTIDIWVDGELASTIESSGTTEDYERYALVAIEATTVVLQAVGVVDNGWLSILEVRYTIPYFLCVLHIASLGVPALSWPFGCSARIILDVFGMLKGRDSGRRRLDGRGITRPKPYSASEHNSREYDASSCFHTRQFRYVSKSDDLSVIVPWETGNIAREMSK